MSTHKEMQNGATCCNKASINIGEAERQASMIGGTVLAVCGLLRGSLSGIALAAIGGALIYRGHTGHCQFYAALNHSSADEHRDIAAGRPRRPEMLESL